MAGRSIPASVSESPGNFIPSALWNTQITNGVYSFGFNPPYFKGQASTAQSVASQTSWTAITLTGAVADTEGGWSSSSPTIYTVQTPGRYLVIATLSWPAFSTTTLACGVGISFGGTTQRVTEASSCASTGAQLQCVFTGFCAVGQTIGMLGMQNSGSAQSTQVGSAQLPNLEVVWLGAH
jgi:hypothetical protein